MAIQSFKRVTHFGIFRPLYGIAIERLVEVNGLESNALIPGLALYIPEMRHWRYRSYAIKTGDTLWQIANAIWHKCGSYFGS